MRYAGQYADAETGLYYNGFRYYDPLTGRYLQPDPLGLSGGLNSYVYALNNPLSYIDPEGQFPLIALLKPMAYFVGGWAVSEAMDYLISYLPDNECNPLLSPQRWANAMTYAVGIGITHKGIKAGYKVWKGRAFSRSTVPNSKIGALNDASKTAFEATKNHINIWAPKDKYLLGTTARKSAQFNTANIENVRGSVKEALTSPNAEFMVNNGDNSFRVVTDMGRVIGTKKQTVIRISIGSDGKIWNAFPVNHY